MDKWKGGWAGRQEGRQVEREREIDGNADIWVDRQTGMDGWINGWILGFSGFLSKIPYFYMVNIKMSLQMILKRFGKHLHVTDFH